MGLPPLQPTEALQSINQSQLGSGLISLDTGEIPGGYADRQRAIANNRVATHTRHMVRWLVPNSGVIEMYVNPQGITYTHAKSINSVRTKGGFALQYWGENLINLQINGTTGSSGIAGINVLYDTYRAEQLAFDPYALALAARTYAQNESLASLLGPGIVSTVTDLFGGQNAIPKPAYQHPTLATLAFQTEMYWSGWVFRGYFESMTITERAEKVGLFDYDIKFVATQKRGDRQNFMPWHHSATQGPSNNHRATGTDKTHGPAYSFNGYSYNSTVPSGGSSGADSLTVEQISSAWNDLKAMF